jgi:hypothetical protein
MAAAAAAAPGRSLDYAESTDRLVYAFLFGHTDTCRVLRRTAVPRFDFATLSRRPLGPDWRGEEGERVIAEFVFGSGRPLHVVPMNDGRLLVAFVNRSPGGGWPSDDRVYDLEEKGYSETIDYSALAPETPPDWPPLERALPHKARALDPPAPLVYAFLARETAPGRLLVARQSEGERGLVLEMRAFAIDVPARRAALPTREELLALLGDPEDLFVGGAAWALAPDGARDLVPRLKAGRASSGAARAAVAEALVRCGDDGARRTLRALLGEDPGARRSAALALARLPPSPADTDALADAAADEDPETAELAGMALVRPGAKAKGALLRLSHSERPGKRAAAARVLARCEGAEEEARLLALAADPDAQTAVARALTRPPRAILKENRGAFGRALLACARARNAEAVRRLSMLAYQARIDEEETLGALVEGTTVDPKAIWALNKLMGLQSVTADDCKRWWQERKRK